MSHIENNALASLVIQAERKLDQGEHFGDVLVEVVSVAMLADHNHQDIITQLIVPLLEIQAANRALQLPAEAFLSEAQKYLQDFISENESPTTR